MKRILFVDDDTQVLDSLAESLAGRVYDWEWVFLDNVEAAMDVLQGDSAFDVVIADSDIGSVKGTDFLSSVGKEHPAAIRLGIAAQMFQGNVFEQDKTAHQYLPKPCNPEELVQSIKRISEMQEELMSRPLMEIVGRIEKLPSVPALYTEIMTELRSPSGTLQHVGEIISKDIAMTTKVLRMANSAFFGFTQRIVDPGHATSLLGINTMTSLVLSSGIFDQSKLPPDSPLNIEDLMDHSAKVAYVARAIAEHEGVEKEFADRAFLAGFLHDIGKLVLASEVSDKYAEVARMSDEEGVVMVQAESEILGSNHAQIGGYLLALWGLPEGVVEAVLRHHWPAPARTKEFNELAAVHVANALVEAGPNPHGDVDVDSQYLQFIGLADSLPIWRSIYMKAASREEQSRPGAF